MLLINVESDDGSGDARKMGERIVALKDMAFYPDNAHGIELLHASRASAALKLKGFVGFVFNGRFG